MKYFLLLITFIQISCVRINESNNLNDTNTFSFQATTEFSDISLKENINFLPTDTTLLFNDTEELFLFLDSLFTLSENTNNDSLSLLSNNLLNKFYSKKSNYNSFNFENTPYSYFAIDYLLNQRDQNGSNIIENLKKKFTHFSLQPQILLKR